MTNRGESARLTSRLAELVPLAAAHRLVDLAQSGATELSAELAPGATYADVQRFEDEAGALLGFPVSVVSKAAAAMPHPAAPDPARREPATPGGALSDPAVPEARGSRGDGQIVLPESRVPQGG